MKSYPLTSLTISEAKEMQFQLVDEITKMFPGDEILTRGDLGGKIPLRAKPKSICLVFDQWFF